MDKLRPWLVLIIVFVTVSFFTIQAGKLPACYSTIIIFRHAEKDTVQGENPPLSEVGVRRAERLSASFPDLIPDAFYSTNYIRTRETLAPWAKKAAKAIEIYDAKNLHEFADMLLKEKGKTIVVTGHANTVPALVNILIGKEKYKTLADNEYSKIFVVTIKNGKEKEKVISY